MEKTARYDDISVGEELEPVSIEVTAEMIRSYGDVLNDQSTYYAHNADFGSPIGQPSLASILAFKPFDKRYPQEPGGIHAKQEFEFYNPIRPGIKAKIFGKIVDKYLKKGRKYVVFESGIEDQDGKLLVRSKTYLILPN